MNKTMKLIKLSEEHYIVVDDSEIKEGDFVYSSDGGIFERHIDNPCQTVFPISKVTHSTQPIEFGWGQEGRDFVSKKVYNKVKRLSLSEVKELLGVVDVEKKALEYNRKKFVSEFNPQKDQFAAGVILGWKQALEDNKEKKYTEEDITEAILRTIDACNEAQKDSYGELEIDEEAIIQSLQPKTEWDVEFNEHGKLTLV